MYTLCSTFFAFATCLDLKWSFKGFDKSVAKVSDFTVISVSAFSERLFVCYQRKFTSVSLRRILKSAIICQKEREGIFFSLLSLLWKDIEGISEEAKQVMKEKIILLRDSSAPVFFLFLF